MPMTQPIPHKVVPHYRGNKCIIASYFGGDDMQQFQDRMASLYTHAQAKWGGDLVAWHCAVFGTPDVYVKSSREYGWLRKKYAVFVMNGSTGGPVSHGIALEVDRNLTLHQCVNTYLQYETLMMA